jgi:hydroxymethylpyrimidine pyrophosphatase-like HAD family hydrolase
MMFVIFDLDGTLAFTEHREHHLRKTPKDWDAFFAECINDTPNLPLIETYNALSLAGHRCAIWTGRSGVMVQQTVDWLVLNGVGMVAGGVGEMVMRREGDHRPDTVLKEEWLASEAAPPDLVFEDRASVVDWWRSKGILCAQVAPGRF